VDGSYSLRKVFLLQIPGESKVMVTVSPGHAVMGQIVKPVTSSFVFVAEYAGQYCEVMERSTTLLAVPLKVS
jgi:hypothetical protein